MINAVMQTALRWSALSDDYSYKKFATGSIFLVNIIFSIPIYNQQSLERSKTRDKNMIISKRLFYWDFIIFNRTYRINLINLLQKVVNIKRQWMLVNELDVEIKEKWICESKANKALIIWHLCMLVFRKKILCDRYLTLFRQ